MTVATFLRAINNDNDNDKVCARIPDASRRSHVRTSRGNLPRARGVALLLSFFSFTQIHTSLPRRGGTCEGNIVVTERKLIAAAIVKKRACQGELQFSFRLLVIFLVYEITPWIHVEPRDNEIPDGCDRYIKCGSIYFHFAAIVFISFHFSYKKKRNRYLAQLIVLRSISRHVAYYENNRRRIVALLF